MPPHFLSLSVEYKRPQLPSLTVILHNSLSTWYSSALAPFPANEIRIDSNHNEVSSSQSFNDWLEKDMCCTVCLVQDFCSQGNEK